MILCFVLILCEVMSRIDLDAFRNTRKASPNLVDRLHKVAAPSPVGNFQRSNLEG